MLYQTFIFLFRPAAFLEHRHIDGVLIVLGADFPAPGPHQHGVPPGRLHKGIHRIGRGNAGDILLGFQAVHIFFREAHRGFQVHIHQILVFKILLSGLFHIRTGGFDAGEKAHTQQHDAQNGKIPVVGAPDLHQDIVQKSFVVFHLITTRFLLPVRDGDFLRSGSLCRFLSGSLGQPWEQWPSCG